MAQLLRSPSAEGDGTRIRVRGTALARESLPDGLKWVHVNGANLPYFERGTGQPVVLVQGGISDLASFDRHASDA